MEKEEDKPKDDETKASHYEKPKDEVPSEKIEPNDDKKDPISSLFCHQPESSAPKPFPKLDMKFQLPKYNGEINAVKIDN